jgi:RNase P subunit RPR2
MGHGITIECESCDYQETFMIGVGMMYASLENVISQVSPARRKEVRDILQHHEVEGTSYEHKMFICPNCDTLGERFDFSIDFDDGQIYEPYFRCSECRTKLVPLKEPISSISCSKCGEITLVSHETIMWD